MSTKELMDELADAAAYTEELEQKLVDAELTIAQMKDQIEEYVSLLGMRMRPWTAEELAALEAAPSLPLTREGFDNFLKVLTEGDES